MVVGLKNPTQDSEGCQGLPPADTELEDVALNVHNLFVEMLEEQ